VSSHEILNAAREIWNCSCA